MVGVRGLLEVVCACRVGVERGFTSPTNFCFLSFFVPMNCERDGEQKGEDRGGVVGRSRIMLLCCIKITPTFLTKVNLLKLVCIKDILVLPVQWGNTCVRPELR